MRKADKFLTAELIQSVILKVTRTCVILYDFQLKRNLAPNIFNIEMFLAPGYK